MTDTKVTRLRNLMTPVLNYFLILQKIEAGSYDDSPLKEGILKILEKEKEQIFKTMEEIHSLFLQIPDDACEKK